MVGAIAGLIVVAWAIYLLPQILDQMDDDCPSFPPPLFRSACVYAPPAEAPRGSSERRPPPGAGVSPGNLLDLLCQEVGRLSGIG